LFSGELAMKRVKGYITRKSMLYKTAVEYGNYSMNHVLGCAHGCKYPCYAFLQKKRFGQVSSYNQWIEPYIVSNTLELLETEIPRYKHKMRSVHLCFTTDPFMYGYEEIKSLSLLAIEKLNKADIKCTVLTKGVLPTELSEFSRENEYGITLISLDESFREKVEPGAAPYRERIAALKLLHDKGFRTWVSIEPYPTPNLVEQDLRDILNEIAFTEKIVFGRTNYNKLVSSYSRCKDFYNTQANLLIDFCKEHNIIYYIKQNTIT